MKVGLKCDYLSSMFNVPRSYILGFLRNEIILL